MSGVRWGVLSTANIGTAQVIPAIQAAERCEVVAIASRNVETAENVAAELGIERAYGSYGQLLNDHEIDAILAWVQTHWSDEIYGLWQQRNGQSVQARLKPQR